MGCTAGRPVEQPLPGATPGCMNEPEAPATLRALPRLLDCEPKVQPLCKALAEAAKDEEETDRHGNSAASPSSAMQSSLEEASSWSFLSPDNDRPAVSHAATAPTLSCTHAAAEGNTDGEAAASAQRSPRRRRRNLRTEPADLLEGSSYNGFRIAAELESMSCSEAFLAPFSLPAEALTHVPDPEDVVTTFRNGDRERKIHTNTPLTQVELEQLAAMRREAKTQGLSFYPSVTSMATRFLSKARMDPVKAVRFMQDTQEWRQRYFRQGPITEASVQEDLRHGIVYFTGRDHALRPAIVVRASRIPQRWYKERSIDKFVRILIFSMEYFLRYMVVPGRVENLSVIIDLQGLGISQVPLGPLGEVYKVMSHHYIGRVYKFYVCNMSSTLWAIAGVAKGFFTDRQKQKINILDDVRDLRKEFAAHQLEKDLGGSRPIIREVFPFSLNPGPFAAGFEGEPDRDAVPDVHRALSFAGSIGRLWDPRHGTEQNTKLDYGPEATPILRKCRLPVPPELRVELETPARALEGRGVQREVPEPEPAPVQEDATAGTSRSPSGPRETPSLQEDGDSPPSETLSLQGDADLPILADVDDLGLPEDLPHYTVRPHAVRLEDGLCSICCRL